LKTDVWTLKTDMSSLKKKVSIIDKRTFVTDAKVDRLENIIVDKSEKLEWMIDNSNKYIDQSFKRISDLQQKAF